MIGGLNDANKVEAGIRSFQSDLTEFSPNRAFRTVDFPTITYPTREIFIPKE
jgi:hypothetical protein